MFSLELLVSSQLSWTLNRREIIAWNGAVLLVPSTTFANGNAARLLSVWATIEFLKAELKPLTKSLKVWLVELSKWCNFPLQGNRSRLKETWGHGSKQECSLQSLMHHSAKRVRLACCYCRAGGTPRPVASVDRPGGRGLGIRGAVCRPSTYASGRIARVKYQEQLQQIEELAAMGARPGKCTL